MIGAAEPSLNCDMPKKRVIEDREIFLGDWLDQFDISVGKAAEIAGVGQSYISNIKAGRRKNINALVLLRLSEHMDITVNDLFRPLPPKSQLNALTNLSTKAQASLLGRKQRKA